MIYKRLGIPSGIGFLEHFLGGHVNVGPVTVFGENAMHWGVTIVTQKWGYVCFRLPIPSFGRWWPLYFYVSPNATPWASTFYIGPSRTERTASVLRRNKYGHNFDCRRMWIACPDCNGRENQSSAFCWLCDGTGEIMDRMESSNG